MTAIARIAAVSLDSDDPRSLATFYGRLLDAEAVFASDDLAFVKAPGVLLTVERVAHHRAPDWPEGPIPKQMHLDLAVDDLDEAQAQACAIGAIAAEVQPSPDLWRVLIDPAGHPFCITTMMGAKN